MEDVESSPPSVPSVDDVYFSIEQCAKCSEVGAEYSCPKSGRIYCHEDCMRADAGLVLASSQIGQELFGDPTLLVGYSLENGAAGVCAACQHKSISLSTTLVNQTIGVCSRECARDLLADFRTANIQTGVSGWLRRRMRHKAYRQREIMAAAAWVWIRARRSASVPSEPTADSYREAMLEVFNALADVAQVGGTQPSVLHVKLWDSFAQFCRCATDAGTKAIVAGAGGMPSNAAFQSETEREGFVPFAENLSIVSDARSAAAVLWKMYLLYWRRYVAYARADKLGTAPADTDMKLRQANDCSIHGRAQNTIHHDVSKSLSKLVTVHKMPVVEARAAFEFGLFRDLAPELEALGGSRAAYEPQHLRLIGDQLLIGPEWWDSFKRQFRSGRETLAFGKKYSVSTIVRLLYNSYLIKSCMPDREREARKLDWFNDIQPAVIAAVWMSGPQKLASEIGFRRTETEAEEKLMEFGVAIRWIVNEKHDRSAARGKESRGRHETRYAQICGTKGEYGKRHGVRFDTIPMELANEIVNMAVYWWSGRSEKIDPRTKRNAHQTQIARDVEGAFDDMAYRTGREIARDYLFGIFDISSATATKALAKVAPAQKAAPPPAPSKEEETTAEA